MILFDVMKGGGYIIITTYFVNNFSIYLFLKNCDLSKYNNHSFYIKTNAKKVVKMLKKTAFRL